MILKREIGIGQLTDVQTSEIDYITRMKAMPFDLYSKKVRAHDQKTTAQIDHLFRIWWEVLVGEMKGPIWPQVTHAFFDAL